MPTKTEVIKRFLKSMTHNDLADLYNLKMECQVNVAQDGGERIEGDFKGRKWHGWTDSLTTWKSFRIPLKANSNPEYYDSKITFDLAEHVEAIGMTGWDWVNKTSKWVAYDFDALTGHSDKHTRKLTEEEMQAVEQAAFEIPWVSIRKSTSGKGLHLYVHISAEVTTNNHHEHSALARAILGLMSAIAGYDFANHVDICGGNMWVWHRKMKGTDGLKVLKQGGSLEEVPKHWKDHVKVIAGRRRKNLPQNVEALGIEDTFEELAGQYPKVQLDNHHRKLITYFQHHKALWWWDQDHHALVTHVWWLKKAHDELSLKGFFDTTSQGQNLNEQNVFLFPLRKGAWAVRRFTPGVREHDSWNQDGAGWTRCFYNRDPDIATACRAYGGLEDPAGGFIFREGEMAMKAAQLLGVQLNIGTPQLSRETKLKQHRDGRLIAEMDYSAQDRGEEMSGWLPKKGKTWTRIFNTAYVSPTESEHASYDDLVRHLVTTTSEDYGWMIKADELWRIEPLHHIKVALGSLGLASKEITGILGSSVFKCWTIVNKPFQPEYPGDREWNRNAARLRYVPSTDLENLKYDHWLSILRHCGSGMDEAVQQNSWCKAYGILNGGDYLKCWIASLFKEPHEPLPYLFLYSQQQGTGKSIFHEALSLLLTKGYQRADAALISQAGFNAELEGAIICVVEETDLKKNAQAYNRIKDWVTSRDLLIHCKGKTPYHIPNSSHWIQCFSGNTWILTTQGARQVNDLINQKTIIYINNKKYPTEGCFKTGIKEIFEITTVSGHKFQATNNHKILCNYGVVNIWKEVKDLEIGTNVQMHNHLNLEWEGEGDFGEGYIIGSLYGDGTYYQGIGELSYDKDDYCMINYITQFFINYPEINLQHAAYRLHSPELTNLMKEYNITKDKKINQYIETASSDFLKGFLSAFFDTDGSCSTNNKDSGTRVNLSQSNLKRLEAIQRILLRFGINSKIYKTVEAKQSKIQEVICQTTDQYQLAITKSNILEFKKRINFQHPDKRKKLIELLKNSKYFHQENFIESIKNIESCGIMPVYDITVPEAHAFSGNGFMLHNCSNNHQACPIFPGDTRITMSYVKPLDPIDLIPKKKLIPLLEKEASDFLADIMNLELPPSDDRLNIPVLETEDKVMLQRLNETSLERFIVDETEPCNGNMLKFSTFYEQFISQLEPTDITNWSKIRVGREISTIYPRGRARGNGQFYIGNIKWRNDEDIKPGTKLRLVHQYLE